MKPMTKAEFIRFVQVADAANVGCYVYRKSHGVYLVRGDERTKLAEGWDTDTAIRHENKYLVWLTASRG